MVKIEHSVQDEDPSGGDEARRHDPRGLDEEVSIVELLNVLLRQRGIALRTTLIVVGLSVVVALTRPTLYTSSTAFLPEVVEGLATGAQALAQRFGVAFGGRVGERTPQFYADLVISGEILRQTVSGIYSFVESPEEGDLIVYYEIGEETREKSVARAVARLRNDLALNIDRETGIVRFSVTMSDPVLAQGVVEYILELVNDFDLTTRQSRASAERLFTGERLARLEGELREAEASLKTFLNENRAFGNSPQLLFEHDRLERAVAMRQELVTSIAQAHERARIEEVRNTPVITRIESPRVPAFRDRKRRVVIVALGIIVGAMLGTIAAFVKNSAEKARSASAVELKELFSLWDETMTDLRRAGRRAPK